MTRTASWMAFLLALAGGPAFSRAQTADAWREDLRFLRETIVRDHPNLFHDVTQADFERAADALDRRIPKLQRHEIIVELSKLVAMFRIGHTYLQLGNWRGPDEPAQFHTIPLFPYAFADGLYVLSAPREHAKLLGARITHIGQLPVADVLERIRPVVIYENEMGYRNAVSFYLNCPEVLHACGVIDDPSRVPMTMEIEGTATDQTFDAEPARPVPGFEGLPVDESDWVDACPLPFDQRPLWLKNLDRVRHFEYLPDPRLLYVRHSAVLDAPDETIAAFFDRVFASDGAEQAEKLVLDLRLNGGGNNYLNKSVITGVIRSRFNARGRFFVITGRKTFSACQNLVNELEKYTEAIFVGEPTAERVNFWGDVRNLTLPNSKLALSLSWMWWQNSDPRDHRVWKYPEIPVELTYAHYRDGGDPALEAILAWQPPGALERSIDEVFARGDLAAARAAVQTLIDDPQNAPRLERIERQVARAADHQVQIDDIFAAIDVLKLNIELFPKSAAAHHQFAELLMKFGEVQEAIAHYRQAAELDPDGTVGRFAAGALKQIGQPRPE